MMFLDVALPGALPVILTGLKLGMGVALLVIVSAEFVGAKSGIGYLIWSSWQVFQIEKMYVGLLLSATLGFGSAILLELSGAQARAVEAAVKGRQSIPGAAPGAGWGAAASAARRSRVASALCSSVRTWAAVARRPRRGRDRNRGRSCAR